MYLIISYYTKNTPYEQVAQQYLIKSLKALNLSYYMAEIPDFGSHQKNANYKPRLISNVLQDIDKDILFLDADAEVLQIPIIFDTINCDIACHELDWATWYGKGNQKELLPGTLFVKNTALMKAVIKLWADLSENSYEWDGHILQKLLAKYKSIRFFNLPLEYCYIKTLPNGDKSRVLIENPIIIQNQVSRIYRRKK